MAEIFEKARNPHFPTLDHMGLRHVLSWPKLGLEPKCHDSGTFGGFGKRAQSIFDIQRIFNTGP